MAYICGPCVEFYQIPIDPGAWRTATGVCEICYSDRLLVWSGHITRYFGPKGRSLLWHPGDIDCRTQAEQFVYGGAR